MGIGIWLVCDFVSSASRNGCVEGLFIRPGLNMNAESMRLLDQGYARKRNRNVGHGVSPIQNLREYAHKI
jgi:hypothetical protein